MQQIDNKTITTISDNQTTRCRLRTKTAVAMMTLDPSAQWSSKSASASLGRRLDLRHYTNNNSSNNNLGIKRKKTNNNSRKRTFHIDHHDGTDTDDSSVKVNDNAEANASVDADGNTNHNVLTMAHTGEDNIFASAHDISNANIPAEHRGGCYSHRKLIDLTIIRQCNQRSNAITTADIEREPYMPWFGIDVGGSLVKIVFFDPKHANKHELGVLRRVRRYLKSAKAYGTTGRRDAHLEMPECSINGRVGTLHFLRFSTSQMPEFLAMAKSKGLANMIKSVCATGGGANKFEDDIKQQLGIKLRKSDELDSVIHGIHYIDANYPTECYYLRDAMDDVRCTKQAYDFSRPYPYLVVNIGSGVSILAVYSPKLYSRISGSSIGGGTFLGLCCLLTGCQTFDEAIELAKGGTTTNVDKLVRDIYGGDYPRFGLSGNTVAASFGHMMSASKRALVTRQDLARATLNMVTLNIGSLARMCALQEGIDNVVFVGNFLRVNQLSMKLLSYAVDYWSKGQMKALFLEHEGYFGAVGCFVESTAGGLIP